MGGTDEQTIRLDIPSRVQWLGIADALVAQIAAAAGFGSDSMLDIRTAVHESLINAIVHGNHADETKCVRLAVTQRPRALVVRVRDEGQGFDPTSVPDPRTPENLSKTSGRGIFLMRALMDEVAFRRLPGGGTEVTMMKRLRPTDRPDALGAPAVGASPERVLIDPEAADA